MAIPSGPVAPVSPIMVYVVDDHLIARQGLELMLSDYPDIRIAGSAENGRRALEGVAKLSPDVVLLDLHLPDQHGLEILAELRRRFPAVQVLIVTMCSHRVLAAEAVHGGAAGYVLKDASKEELVAAIRKVAAGERYLASLIVDYFVHSNRDSGELSPREGQVLRLVADGHSNREIGERLFLSPETVKTHVSAICKKLQAADRTHAVSIAIRTGLMP